MPIDLKSLAETLEALATSKWRNMSTSLIVAILFPLLFGVIWVIILLG